MRLKQIILPLLFINLFLFFTADSEASSYVAQPPANDLYLTPIKGTKKNTKAQDSTLHYLRTQKN